MTTNLVKWVSNDGQITEKDSRTAAKLIFFHRWRRSP